MNIKFKIRIEYRVFKILLFLLKKVINRLFKVIDRLFERFAISIIWFFTILVDFPVLYYAVKDYCSSNPNKWSWVAFYIVNLIMLSLSVFLASKEHKRENAYMSNFWGITWLFMVAICLLTIWQQSNISRFLSNKNRDNGFFIFFILVFILMIIAWGIYLGTAKKSLRKTKNIDVTELIIIFSKSVLQSIVSFIALLGLSSLSLSNGLLHFALITDIYAAYIYPILDINKYVREKEIEQLKDKNKTII